MRRAPLALVLALGLAGPAQADLVYVLNSGEASITVLDATTREEVQRIPVLREPHHLLLTPDRRELIVADAGGNEFVYINPDTAEVLRRLRISNPYHLEYSPDGRTLVITSLRRDQVDIYDAASLTLLQRLRVGDKPSHLAFSPDSRMVYVTLQGVKGLLAVDLESRKPVWSAEIGSQPAGVIWHRGRLLAGIMGSDHLVVVDPADGRVERRVAIGRGAHTIFAAPDGSALYATSRVDSRITVLDPATLAVRTTWEVPGGPDCISFAPDGRLWVTLRWIARVAVVDPREGLVETIAVGRSPHGIFVHPRAPGVPLPVPVIGEAEPPAARVPTSLGGTVPAAPTQPAVAALTPADGAGAAGGAAAAAVTAPIPAATTAAPPASTAPPRPAATATASPSAAPAAAGAPPAATRAAAEPGAVAEPSSATRPAARRWWDRLRSP